MLSSPFYLMRGLLEFSHYKNTSTDFSTTAHKCQDFSKVFVSIYLVFHDFMFILHSVQPCSLRHSIFKCWDWPSSGHNSRQVTLNLEEIQQCWIQWSNTSLRLEVLLSCIQTQFLSSHLFGSCRNYRRGINDEHLQHQLASRDTILFPCFSCIYLMTTVTQTSSLW